MVRELIYVAMGGAIGSAIRYGISRWVQLSVGSSFPWGTLVVNGLGCLLIGVVLGCLERKQLLDSSWLLFGVVGVLGGFTTFSTFSAECIGLLRGSHLTEALLYVSISMVGGLALTAVGYAFVKG